MSSDQFDNPTLADRRVEALKEDWVKYAELAPADDENENDDESFPCSECGSPVYPDEGWGGLCDYCC